MKEQKKAVILDYVYEYSTIDMLYMAQYMFDTEISIINSPIFLDDTGMGIYNTQLYMNLDQDYGYTMHGHE